MSPPTAATTKASEAVAASVLDAKAQPEGALSLRRRRLSSLFFFFFPERERELSTLSPSCIQSGVRLGRGRRELTEREKVQKSLHVRCI